MGHWNTTDGCETWILLWGAYDIACAVDAQSFKVKGLLGLRLLLLLLV